VQTLRFNCGIGTTLLKGFSTPRFLEHRSSVTSARLTVEYQLMLGCFSCELQGAIFYSKIIYIQYGPADFPAVGPVHKGKMKLKTEFYTFHILKY